MAYSEETAGGFFRRFSSGGRSASRLRKPKSPQEIGRRAVHREPKAHRFAATDDFDETLVQQGLQGGDDLHAPDLLDLGACQRLLVRDDRQRLMGRPSRASSSSSR